MLCRRTKSISEKTEKNEDVLKEYGEGLRKILKNIVIEGGDLESRYSHDLFILESEKIKKIFSNERMQIKKIQIEYLVNTIVKSKNDKEILEYSKKLKDYFQSDDYKKVIQNKISCLYNRKFFPVDDMNDTKNRFCRNIGYILYDTNKENFLEYCKQLEEDCDKMAIHRLKNFIKYFDGEK